MTLLRALEEVEGKMIVILTEIAWTPVTSWDTQRRENNQGGGTPQGWREELYFEDICEM